MCGSSAVCAASRGAVVEWDAGTKLDGAQCEALIGASLVPDAVVSLDLADEEAVARLYAAPPPVPRSEAESALKKEKSKEKPQARPQQSAEGGMVSADQPPSEEGLSGPGPASVDNAGGLSGAARGGDEVPEGNLGEGASGEGASGAVAGEDAPTAADAGSSASSEAVAATAAEDS